MKERQLRPKSDEIGTRPKSKLKISSAFGQTFHSFPPLNPAARELYPSTERISYRSLTTRLEDDEETREGRLHAICQPGSLARHSQLIQTYTQPDGRRWNAAWSEEQIKDSRYLQNGHVCQYCSHNRILTSGHDLNDISSNYPECHEAADHPDILLVYCSCHMCVYFLGGVPC